MANADARSHTTSNCSLLATYGSVGARVNKLPRGLHSPDLLVTPGSLKTLKPPI
jgi:hypothetical protein